MAFNFKKKYGQNFLKNDYIINKIIDCIDSNDSTLIVEIGPGSGALTKKLLKFNTNLVCYEIDKELSQFLDNLDTKNLEIIYDDFMKRDYISDIKKYKYDKLIVVGNLPYYITTPIILKLLEQNVIPDEMIFMVQKEVAERFASVPGNKSYGSITVLLNCFYNVQEKFIVKRAEFVPIPNVDSAVVKFTKKDENEIKDFSKFKKFIHDCFQFKRKKLSNNLKNYDKDKILKVLEKYNKNLDNRAEELSIDVFIDMFNNL